MYTNSCATFDKLGANRDTSAKLTSGHDDRDANIAFKVGGDSTLLNFVVVTGVDSIAKSDIISELAN